MAKQKKTKNDLPLLKPFSLKDKLVSKHYKRVESVTPFENASFSLPIDKVYINHSSTSTVHIITSLPYGSNL